MRTVAIVGDSKGIGLALRGQLLADGVRVIGVSRTGAQAAGDYTGLVFDAVAHPCDLSSFTDRLDGLVYCPGTISLKPVRGTKPEQVLEDFRVNALGFLQTVQANLKLLKAAAASPEGGAPSVVGFSTVAVQTGMGFHASIAAAKVLLKDWCGPWLLNLHQTSGSMRLHLRLRILHWQQPCCLLTPKERPALKGTRSSALHRQMTSHRLQLSCSRQLRRP